MIVMPDERTVAPDSTAVRTVMWRAMHVQIDPPPHVFEDEIGLKLAALDEGWRNRQDMNPQGTRRFRAAIVARARFVEDLVTEQASCGVGQYVILGAGLDTFVQRRPEIASRLRVFEVDRPGPREGKHQRLLRARLRRPLDVHSFLHVVPVDFEAGAAWWERLVSASFETSQPAVVASTGVSMYLTKDATAATLRHIAALVPGSTLVMTFMLPIDLIEPEDYRGFEWARKGAAASGTPFATQFTLADMLALARDAGFRNTQHVLGTTLAQRYFSGRTDGLRPSSGEDFLVAKDLTVASDLPTMRAQAPRGSALGCSIGAVADAPLDLLEAHLVIPRGTLMGSFT
jgi:methyltransferase (TIGR00027 family)